MGGGTAGGPVTSSTMVAILGAILGAILDFFKNYKSGSARNGDFFCA